MLFFALYNSLFKYKESPVKDYTQPIPQDVDGRMGPHYETLLKATAESIEKLNCMVPEMHTIKTKEGFKLVGRLFKAENKTDNVVMLLHGYNSKGMKDNAIKAIGYLNRGFNVLLVDNRACGDSEGRYQTCGAKESLDDLIWIDKLVRMFPNGDIIIDGCSMGAATACLISKNNLPKNVKMIVSDCAYMNFGYVFKELIHRYVKVGANILYAGISFWCTIMNGGSFKKHSPLKAVENSTVPMIFIHGKEDRYIPYESAEELYNNCAFKQKELVFVENAGHVASCEKNPDKYFGSVLDFYNKIK